jgi:anti-sigma factor RsiW
MDCKHVREAFIDYQDEELTAQDRQEFETHINDCDACRAELEEYQKAVNEISSLNLIEPFDGFPSRVKETIEKRSKGRFFGPQNGYSLRFAIISFVLILFLILAYYCISAGFEVTLISETPPSKQTEKTE